MGERWHHNAFSRPAPQPRQSDAARWQGFCASIVDTIEQIRAEEPPTRCETCGCSGHERTQACRVCWDIKPLREFKRDRRAASGHASICAECDSQRNRQQYQRRKRARVLAVAV